MDSTIGIASSEVTDRNDGLSTGLDLEHLNSRQNELLSLERLSALKVLVLGVGGIGSNAVHLMASMGVGSITIVDKDRVGVENIWPGFFNAQDAKDGGLWKTDAIMYDVLWRLGHKNVLPVTGDLKELIPNLIAHCDLWDIVLTGTDSISSREIAWSGLYRNTKWWIDGRMGGPGAEVFALSTDDVPAMTEYATSFTKKVEPLPCGQKATAPLTKGWLVGMIGQALIDITTDKLPLFYSSYNIEDRRFLQAEVLREDK